MKLSLARSVLALALSALVFQACSSSTNVEPAKEGKLVFGGSGSGASIIDMGTIAVGGQHDTSILIANTGSGDLVVTSSGSSSTELTGGFAAHDTIVSGGFKNVLFHAVPADTGTRFATDTIYYTTAGKTASLALNFKFKGQRVLPGPGSSYTFSVTMTDTNNVTTTLPDRTVQVVANDLYYGGDSNVVEVIDDSGNTSYFHKEANGDVSAYVDLSAAQGAPFQLPSAWFTIPLGSKQEIQQTLVNQKNVTIPGIPVPVDILVESDATYTGPATVNGAGTNFATQSGALQISATFSGLAGLIKATQKETGGIWYSNDLAFYAKRTQATQAIGSSRKSTETWTIKSYIIK